MKVQLYDIETLINCFTVTFLSADEGDDEHHSFVVSDNWDDRDKLIAFASNVRKLAGYNNVAFDSPVLRFLLNEIEADEGLTPGGKVAFKAYQVAQEVISEEKKTARMGLGIPELDLFLIHHFNNPARSTSLKWLECYYKMENIQDMPHSHDKIVTTDAEINMILKYNLNDCRATKKLLLDKRTIDLIKIRKWAVETYDDARMFNTSNSTMGEKILYKMLEKEGPVAKPYEPRDFYLKEVIFPYITFKTPEFNEVLHAMKDFKVTAIPKLDVRTRFGGMEYLFGLGGLHAAREGQVFENVESVDVTSYYPNIAIENKMYPRHLSASYVKVYADIYAQRKLTKKGSPMNLAYKETLNSAIGKSNSEYSFLRDAQFNFGITVNGQLLLAMLAERIELTCGKVVMANTDGLEAIITDYEKFNNLLDKWQKLTRLTLERAQYHKIMIRDVNNYIAVKAGTKEMAKIDDVVKVKGAYEYEKDFHKDHSMKAVPMAVAHYFIGGEERLDLLEGLLRGMPTDHFFMYARCKTGKFVALAPDGAKTAVPKTIRYLITKTGYTLTRQTDKKMDKIHKDGFVSIINDLADCDPGMEELRESIDFQWYVNEAKKLIMKKPIKELLLF